jgi:predicted CoA-binding protein
MTSRAAVEGFLAQSDLAVVGVSRSGKKFGNMVYRELRAKGYHLVPIHPEADELEGDKCYATFQILPTPVGGVVIIVPPEQTEQVVREAAAANIKRVWMQQGAESAEAISFCSDNGIEVVHGECILMFAEPSKFYHRLHRWVWKLSGKLPN